mmetsp:Transcript_43196/g.68306  ORF Transcript_43196/g.68306 Transcript_43196/m.68306 type:complete len:344 (-) Transcript_43196:162-1193(-)
MTAGPKSGKKVGPNDKCSCGSGLKAKKCCLSAGAGFSSIASDCKGRLISGQAEELHKTAKEAVGTGDYKKAAHFYTMAVDALAKNMKIDANGCASDADLLALTKSSDGLLGELLCGRSQVYLRQGDMAAALEDAETCTRADPSCEKGYLRLLEAYELAGVSLRQQLQGCEQGLETCPHSEALVTRKWRLKKALAEQGDVTETIKSDEQGIVDQIAQTRRIADDQSDPRRAMAAVDLGRSLAVGAHGLQKDLSAAVRYLRIGVEGGDVSAQRELGCILLEIGEPVEAAEHLKMAAEAGDEEAAGILQKLLAEAEERRKDARAKLEKLAALGDLRAREMLQEMFG